MAENVDGLITPTLPGGAGASFAPYSPSLHSFLREAREEGERINRSDPAFGKADDVIAYIQGSQPSYVGPRVDYLPNVVLNQLKKAIKSHVSALTDVRPLVGWKTMNPSFQDHSHILNQYGTIWWVNTTADAALADGIKYSLAAGSGDLTLEWNPHFQGGESQLEARDPRDTLPFRPEKGASMQTWEGVTFRTTYTVNKLLRRYPGRKDVIKQDSGAMPAAATRFYRTSVRDYTPPSTLDGLKGGNPLRGQQRRYEDIQGGYQECTLYNSYFHDNQLNLEKQARLMGRPGTAWSYIVEPGKAVYPRGRQVLWTEHGILYDGPNTYWHGLYPCIRLKLDPWPWLFGGMGLMNDMRQVQDIINYLTNDFLSLISQYVNRGTLFDKTVPESVFHRFDPRKPNWKVRRPNAFSDGMKQAEVPQLPAWAFQFLQVMFQKFDELSGTANLQALLQLRQAPGEGTIEKFLQALTPEIRAEARQVELGLREVGTMLKSNLFQFVSRQRRYALLGDAGVVLQDLDYDPDTLVPAMAPDDPGYVPDLDAQKTRDQRAQFFMNQFTYYTPPQSMLNYTAMERKMLMLQLARQGYVDIWTLAEVLEIPNMGAPPPMQLPPVDWEPSPQESQPPLVWRVPRTITERLMAQQQLGLGQTVSPAGRKASGQQAPHMEQKGDGRTTVSESA